MTDSNIGLTLMAIGAILIGSLLVFDVSFWFILDILIDIID